LARIDGDGGLALDRSDLDQVGKIRRARRVKDQVRALVGDHRIKEGSKGRWEVADLNQREYQAVNEMLSPSRKLEIERGQRLNAETPKIPMRINGEVVDVDARFEEQAVHQGARRAFHGRARISKAPPPKRFKLVCGHFRWLDATHTDNLCPFGCA
jgi:hypothetical protein